MSDGLANARMQEPLPPDLIRRIEALYCRYPQGRQASAVVPALWLVQKRHGWLPEPAIRAVAELLGMPPVRVQEIATFYSMFNLRPVGRWLVQVCGTTPCALRGAGRLMEACERRIGPRGKISADGRLSWCEVECLGACVDAPVVQVNDAYYEDLDPESFAALLDDPEGFVAAEKERGAKGTLSDPDLYDGSRAEVLKSIPNAPESD